MKFFLILIFVSCAQHRIGNDAAGIFIAKHSSLDKEDALRTALAEARIHCDGDRMIVVSRKVVYEGKISEEENQKIKDKANESVMLGKGGLDQAELATSSGNLYHSEVKFRCK